MRTVRVACDLSPVGFYVQDYDKIPDNAIIYKDKISGLSTIRKPIVKTKHSTEKLG